MTYFSVTKSDFFANLFFVTHTLSFNRCKFFMAYFFALVCVTGFSFCLYRLMLPCANAGKVEIYYIADGLPDGSGNTFVRNEQKIAAYSRN